MRNRRTKTVDGGWLPEIDQTDTVRGVPQHPTVQRETLTADTATDVAYTFWYCVVVTHHLSLAAGWEEETAEAKIWKKVSSESPQENMRHRHGPTFGQTNGISLG